MADDEISMLQLCPLDLLHSALCICCTLQPQYLSVAQEETVADKNLFRVQICHLHSLTACTAYLTLPLCMAQKETVADSEVIMVHFSPASTARTQQHCQSLSPVLLLPGIP